MIAPPTHTPLFYTGTIDKRATQFLFHASTSLRSFLPDELLCRTLHSGDVSDCLNWGHCEHSPSLLLVDLLIGVVCPSHGSQIFPEGRFDDSLLHGLSHQHVHVWFLRLANARSPASGVGFLCH